MTNTPGSALSRLTARVAAEIATQRNTAIARRYWIEAGLLVAVGDGHIPSTSELGRWDCTPCRHGVVTSADQSRWEFAIEGVASIEVYDGDDGHQLSPDCGLGFEFGRSVSGAWVDLPVKGAFLVIVRCGPELPGMAPAPTTARRSWVRRLSGMLSKAE
jgi:hypothetical protein